MTVAPATTPPLESRTTPEIEDAASSITNVAITRPPVDETTAIIVCVGWRESRTPSDVRARNQLARARLGARAGAVSPGRGGKLPPPDRTDGGALLRRGGGLDR